MDFFDSLERKFKLLLKLKVVFLLIHEDNKGNCP